MSSEYEVFEVAVSPVSEEPPPLARTDHSAPDRTRARELFERLATLPHDDPERARIRATLVELDRKSVV